MTLSKSQREANKMWRFLAKSLLQQACEELGYDYAVKWEGQGSAYNTAYCIPGIMSLAVHENDCRLRAYHSTYLHLVGQGKQTLDLRYPNVSDDIRKFVKKAVECHRRCAAQVKDFENNFWPKLQDKASHHWLPDNTHETGFRLQCENAYSSVHIDFSPGFRPFRKDHTKLILNCERTPSAKFEIESVGKFGGRRVERLFFGADEWFYNNCYVPVCYETVLNILDSLQKQADQFDQMVADFIDGVYDYFHDDFDTSLSLPRQTK